MRTTLTISTILGDQQVSGDQGPLLLSAVQGMEGISMPYAYDVTMFREIKDGDIDPGQMIGTRATIGMRAKTDSFTFRRGIFQTFDKAGTNELNFERGLQNDYRVYKARIVPAWKLLDFESRYRVFENMTMIEIMIEVMQGFHGILNGYLDFNTYMSFQYLEKMGDFKKIPYCVQYGESSLSFLHRLMSQFGIWYAFDHNHTADDDTKQEMMLLGNSVASFSDCFYSEMDIVYGAPDVKEITGFQRTFLPPHKRVWVSDYNMVNPTDVPRGKQEAKSIYDMMPGAADPTPFQRESFPAVMTDPVDSSAVMADQAKDRIEDEEGNTFNIQGQSKNPTFIAGGLFHIAHDKTKASNTSDTRGHPAGDKYLITQLSFAAYDNSYGHTWNQEIVNWLDSPLRWVWGLFRKESTQSGNYMDPMGALATGGLANWVQNQAVTNTTPPPPPGWPKDNPYQMNFLDSYMAGMNTAFVQALTQLYLVNAPKEILARYADGYSNAFMAVPWDAKDYKLTPGPDAGKPRAYGPQLAVVVGPQGSKNIAAGGDSDLYADGLGRVRVRFPWQREVPTGANQSGSTDPLETDRRTCWVPVSESWAGANFGTQFLPRIGQEVIVSFLDGDPERPIITGRRYNADHGYSNLPFPPDEVDVEAYNMDDWNGPGPGNNFPFNGIKTASTKTARADSSGGKSRYHLMRFDDTYNCEQLLLRSQGRLDVTAYAHTFDTAYGNRNLKTGKGTDKDGKPFGGNMFNTVDGEYDVHVGGSHYTQVEKDYELTVKGDVQADIKGALKAVIKGDVSISMNSLVIEATQKITLKVGGSFIVIDPSEVHLNGCNVYKTPSGSADSAASVTLQNVADATPAEPGDKWNQRLTPCHAASGSGGSRGTHTESPTPGPNCTSVPGGSIKGNFLPDPSPSGGGGGGGDAGGGGGGGDAAGGSDAGSGFASGSKGL
jgi:uncharacterized protein involved in type VI secretion and phage assembly